MDDAQQRPTVEALHWPTENLLEQGRGRLPVTVGRQAPDHLLPRALKRKGGVARHVGAAVAARGGQRPFLELLGRLLHLDHLGQGLAVALDQGLERSGQLFGAGAAADLDAGTRLAQGGLIAQGGQVLTEFAEEAPPLPPHAPANKAADGGTEQTGDRRRFAPDAAPAEVGVGRERHRHQQAGKQGQQRPAEQVGQFLAPTSRRRGGARTRPATDAAASARWSARRSLAAGLVLSSGRGHPVLLLWSGTARLRAVMSKRRGRRGEMQPEARLRTERKVDRIRGRASAAEVSEGAMKQITVDPTIGESGKWVEGVRRANRMLEMIQGPSTKLATADWTLTQDERRNPVLELKLSDPTDSVEGRFTPEEFEDGERLWHRLFWLWDNLLRARINSALQRAEAAFQQVEEG